jgi:glycosyltransferase involved in cell wall biosynthesis
MNKINVLLYIDSLMIGGMHRQTLFLAKYLDKNIFNVIVLTQNTNKGGLRNEFLKTNCKILDLGRNSIPSNKKPFNPFLSLKLYNILNKENIDLVYLNAAPNLIYFQIAKLFIFRKIVQIGSFRALTFWKGHLNPRLKLIDNFFARLLYHTSDFTIVNSNALLNHYSEILKVKTNKPLIVINNGSDFDMNIKLNPIEIRNQLNLVSDDVFLIMVARLDPWKDFKTIIKTISILRIKHPKLKLYLIGEGSERTNIEYLININNLQNNIFLLGEKQNSIDYINACDISVLSTYGEGFSNTVLESMYLKKPMVATKVGGNVDMIGLTEEFGFLVPPESPSEFAQKIEILISNINLRSKIGEAANLKITEMCNMQLYIDSYKSIFLSNFESLPNE